jgi:hypothetical protein
MENSRTVILSFHVVPEKGQWHAQYFFADESIIVSLPSFVGKQARDPQLKFYTDEALRTELRRLGVIYSPTGYEIQRPL